MTDDNFKRIAQAMIAIGYGSDEFDSSDMDTEEMGSILMILDYHYDFTYRLVGAMRRIEFNAGKGVI